MQDARALADAANNSDAEAEDPNIALEKAKPFPPLNLLLHKPAELELKESAEAAASFEYDANAVGTAIGLSHDEVAQLKSEHLTWRSYLLHAQQELVTTGSRFVLKTVLDLAKCRIFRVNQRSNRVTFRMHVLLLNTTATNLEVSVEPERGFSFMNATKTVSRNSLIENTLNNLMVVGLHSPCVLKAANDLEAKRQLDEFLESCLTKWDSVAARRCRSALYNDDKDKAVVVSSRQKKLRQDTLLLSSFAQLAAINEKEKLVEKDEVKAGFVNVPLKQKQAELGSYFSKVVDSAGQKEAKHKEKVLKKRKRRAQPESKSEEIVEKEAKKLKKNNKKKEKALSNINSDGDDGEEARWLNRADQADGQMNREGKIISVVPAAGALGKRNRKQIIAT